jgi:hypothetical protein
MAGKQSFDRLHDEAVHLSRALAARFDAHALEQAGVVQDGLVGQFHQILRSSETRGATIRR